MAAAALGGLLLGLLPAVAGAWTCRNDDLEIGCDAEGCSVSESFTPMSVAFDEKGQMSVCAYSGCWEGKANQIVSSNDYLILAASRLDWTQGSGADASIGVLLDRRSGIAVLNGAGYAHPMTCQP